MKQKHFEQNIATLQEVFNQKKFGKLSFWVLWGMTGQIFIGTYFALPYPHSAKILSLKC
jgi:hypothetical protein